MLAREPLGLRHARFTDSEGLLMHHCTVHQPSDSSSDSLALLVWLVPDQ